MSDSETSAVREGPVETDGNVSVTVERLLGAWRQRLIDDRSAGGEAGEIEASLIDELVAGLPDPVDLPPAAPDGALQVARRLGERAADIDTATLHLRLAHLRNALVMDLLEREGPGLRGCEGDRVDACLSRADELVGPLVVAALDGRDAGVASSSRGQRDEREQGLVRRLRHDIKTPLQAASLNLELLALDRAGDASDIETIETIQASIDQVVEMLRPLDEATDEATLER